MTSHQLIMLEFVKSKGSARLYEIIEKLFLDIPEQYRSATFRSLIEQNMLILIEDDATSDLNYSVSDMALDHLNLLSENRRITSENQLLQSQLEDWQQIHQQEKAAFSQLTQTFQALQRKTYQSQVVYWLLGLALMVLAFVLGYQTCHD